MCFDSVFLFFCLLLYLFIYVICLLFFFLGISLNIYVIEAVGFNELSMILVNLWKTSAI